MKKNFLFLFFLGCSFYTMAQKSVIPNVEVTDPEDKKVNILDIIDRLTIIDYWATWCKPCIAEMPYLEEIKNKYPNKLQVISISADQSTILWKRYLAENKKSDHQYWVAADHPLIELITTKIPFENGEFSKTWSIPRFFLVDKNGKILNDQCPEPSTGKLELLIDQYLKQ